MKLPLLPGVPNSKRSEKGLRYKQGDKLGPKRPPPPLPSRAEVLGLLAYKARLWLLSRCIIREWRDQAHLEIQCRLWKANSLEQSARELLFVWRLDARIERAFRAGTQRQQ